MIQDSIIDTIVRAEIDVGWIFRTLLIDSDSSDVSQKEHRLLESMFELCSVISRYFVINPRRPTSYCFPAARRRKG